MYYLLALFVLHALLVYLVLLALVSVFSLIVLLFTLVGGGGSPRSTSSPDLTDTPGYLNPKR